MTRGTNICFGLVMIIMTGVLSFSYIKDELRGECREDSKYKDMRIISVITLCIVLVTTFLLFFVSCKIICRAERKSQLRENDAQLGSSDEEDDKNFLERHQVFRQNYREQLNLYTQQRNNLVRDNVRELFVDNERRRNILG